MFDFITSNVMSFGRGGFSVDWGFLIGVTIWAVPTVARLQIQSRKRA